MSTFKIKIKRSDIGNVYTRRKYKILSYKLSDLGFTFAG